MTRCLPPMMVRQSLCPVGKQAVWKFLCYHEAVQYVVASFQMHLKGFIWFKIVISKMLKRLKSLKSVVTFQLDYMHQL